MPEQTSSIISKVWSLCNPLRDDGVSYGDYLEQLTYLIFLKMSDEYSKPPYKKETGIPEGFTWQDMNGLKGAELEGQYKATLEKLGEQTGLLGQIFKQATNKISNAAILYKVVQMIDKEKWVSMSSDVKGGMGRSQEEERRAVECGYWHLWRYNPLLAEEGKNPFSLDSKEPDWDKFQDFLDGEVRYLSVKKAYPAEAEELFAEAKKMAQIRYKSYVRKSKEDWNE